MTSQAREHKHRNVTVIIERLSLGSEFRRAKWHGKGLNW